MTVTDVVTVQRIGMPSLLTVERTPDDRLFSISMILWVRGFEVFIAV